MRNTYRGGQQVIDIEEIIWLDVDMMCGIEYEEFPARIAELAMWLVDHQMNMLISNEFRQYFARLPLKKAANIVILGNPPFVGSKIMSQFQRNSVVSEFENIQGSGVLDYSYSLVY
jgi:hypothetical protein